MLSMTGFGKGEAGFLNEYFFSVEIGSVNRKQLEIRCSLPPELSGFEAAARRRIGENIGRGAIQLRATLRYAGESAAGVEINRALLEELARTAAEVRKELDLPADALNVEQLFSVPGVLKPRVLTAEAAGVGETFAAALERALENFQEMRRREGAALRTDFENRIGKLEELLRRIEPLAAAVPGLARKRLEMKFGSENPPLPVESEQFTREMLFYLDKSDVSEEITRLQSHFRQFRVFLDSPDPVGRSMDFLAQECFREITV